jgi:hypothetical protein
VAYKRSVNFLLFFDKFILYSAYLCGLLSKITAAMTDKAPKPTTQTTNTKTASKPSPAPKTAAKRLAQKASNVPAPEVSPTAQNNTANSVLAPISLPPVAAHIVYTGLPSNAKQDKTKKGKRKR